MMLCPAGIQQHDCFEHLLLLPVGLSAVKDAMDRVDREELSWQLLDISECALGTSGG